MKIIPKFQPEGVINYKVEYGDTVSDIAKAYGVTIKEIKEANNLNDKYFIKAGLNLIVPIENSKNEDVKKALVKSKLKFDPFEDDEKLKGKYVSSINYLDKIEITPRRHDWSKSNTTNLSSKPITNLSKPITNLSKPITNLSKSNTNKNKESSKKETPTSNLNDSSKLKATSENLSYSNELISILENNKGFSFLYPTTTNEQTNLNHVESNYVKTKKLIDYYQNLIDKDILKNVSSIHSYIKYIGTTKGKKAVVVSILRDDDGHRVGVFENGKLVSTYSNTGNHDNTYVTKIKH